MSFIKISELPSTYKSSLNSFKDYQNVYMYFKCLTVHNSEPVSEVFFLMIWEEKGSVMCNEDD